MLLAGSIIEAVLVDFFLAFPHQDTTPDKILKANLATLIEWAEHDELISSSTKEISTVIKNYRNLIHPGREYRLKEKVDEHRAKVAVSLVEIIIQEISENYAKRRGYTSEQAIEKIKVDPSSTSIFSHMLGKMAPVERIRLFRAIIAECNMDGESEVVKESLIKLHEQLKDVIPSNVLKEEVENVYEYVRTKSKFETMFYLRFFANDLNLIDAEKRETIITYMMDVLQNGKGTELDLYRRWRIYLKIGKYLKDDSGTNKVFRTVFNRIEKEIINGDEIFLQIVGDQVLLDMSYEQGSEITSKLEKCGYTRAKEWASTLDENRIPF